MNAELEKWIEENTVRSRGIKVVTVQDLRALFAGKVLANNEVPMMKMEPFQTIDRGSKNYAAGWNACRLAMLAASQEQVSATAQEPT
jgi:hypothetical protein